MGANIVVGIDGSAPSRSAVDWAVERALATGVAIELFHAVEHHSGRHSTAFAAKTLHDAEEMLEAAASSIESRELTVVTELFHGDPFEGLVHKSRTAEILVVGTHKTGFIQGRSIGSRFIGLSAMSRCPVAFIPHVSLISRRGVSLVLDDSPTGRRAAIFAATEAERRSQKLTLIHGEPWHVEAGESDKERATRNLAVTDETRAAISLQVVALADGHPLLETKTLATRKSLAIAAIDASMSSRLLVISNPQARSSIGSPSGQFVHDVILNLSGPVVVIPRADTIET